MSEQVWDRQISYVFSSCLRSRYNFFQRSLATFKKSKKTWNIVFYFGSDFNLSLNYRPIYCTNTSHRIGGCRFVKRKK